MDSAKADLHLFLKDTALAAALPKTPSLKKLALYEYPFDHQLLGLSPIYQISRKHYLALGGKYLPRISSTMRSLTAQDLFKNEIDYTPSESELIWFKNHHKEVYDPEQEKLALERFNTISVFHEQNHRVIWNLLPPAPKEERDLLRYLNFSESLVVMLDLALADEIGGKLSLALERMKVIYRTSGNPKWKKKGKAAYRNYLLAIFCSTYYVLELINPEDILKAVDYVFPSQKKLNKDAVSRSLDISELFTRITNPQWQERYWKKASQSLARLHKKSKADALYLPEDPLDLEEEFIIAKSILSHFNL